MNTIEDASIISVLVIRVLFLPEHSYSTDHIPPKTVHISMSNLYHSSTSIGPKYSYWRVEEVACWCVPRRYLRPVWLQGFNVIQKMQIYDRSLSQGVRTRWDAVVNTFSFIFLSLLNDASVIPLINVGGMANRLDF